MSSLSASPAGHTLPHRAIYSSVWLFPHVRDCLLAFSSLLTWARDKRPCESSWGWKMHCAKVSKSCTLQSHLLQFCFYGSCVFQYHFSIFYFFLSSGEGGLCVPLPCWNVAFTLSSVCSVPHAAGDISTEGCS